MQKHRNEAQQRRNGLHGNAACHATVVEGKFSIFNTIPVCETLRMEFLRSTAGRHGWAGCTTATIELRNNQDAQGDRIDMSTLCRFACGPRRNSVVGKNILIP